MAEVRKHRPHSAGSIGDQVRAVVPTGPNVVEPGSVPGPVFDPYVDAEADQGVSVAESGFAATSFNTHGWFSLGDDAVEVLKAANRKPVPMPSADEDEADFDDYEENDED